MINFNFPPPLPPFVNRSQVENPNHLDLMMNYRVRECPYFIHGRCRKDIPFTCFNYHHPTQRRRPSMRNEDGSSNYSLDIYCPLYDESTGFCPNGDGCPYVHKVYGNMEQMYHVDVFKTMQCKYELNEYGVCKKNGRLCAFAHGPQDMRQRFSTLSALELDQFLISYNKTQPCLTKHCTVAFRCSYYHGSWDRRRRVEMYPWRPLPCPYVKKNGYWQNPESCPMKDACHFCHTANELFYHPQIFKTKICGQLMKMGKCQRGVFCAFAHGQSELRAATNQLEPTPTNDVSKPGFLERPPGIPTPSNLSIPQLDTGSFNDQDSGLPSLSSEDPSFWSIWSSSDNPNSAILSRCCRYNSSSSEEYSDILKMLDEDQKTILKSFGTSLFLDDDTVEPCSAQNSPVEKSSTVMSASVKLSNNQMFDIFEELFDTNACFRCGRDKDGSGACPMCSK